MWSEIRDDLFDDFRARPEVQSRIDDVSRAVAAGTLSPAAAARELRAAGSPVRTVDR